MPRHSRGGTDYDGVAQGVQNQGPDITADIRVAGRRGIAPFRAKSEVLDSWLRR